MEHYKMLCLDIDGTLLDSSHRIKKATKEAIQQTVLKNKTLVVLVSVKMPSGIRFLQEELNIQMPYVCYSGGLIVNTILESSKPFNKKISINVIQKVNVFIKNEGVQINLYKDDEWYIEQLDENVQLGIDITGKKPVITSFTSLFDDWLIEGNGPNKILCIGKEDKIEVLEMKLLKLYGDILNIHRSKPNYLEIVDKNISKASAINYLQSQFSILTSQIIAIGDNFNDIDMIKYAGLGVAMGNAPEKVKKYADEVKKSNDDDGIAHIINKYLLVGT